MTNEQYIREFMDSLQVTHEPYSIEMQDRLSSELLLRCTRRAMSDQLDATTARINGHWWNAKEIQISDLLTAFDIECAKGHDIEILDILNLAAMIYIRQSYETPE